MKDICASCTTNCCENYTVFINGFDLYRIVEHTGLHPSKFVNLYSDVEEGGRDYHFTLGEDLWLKMSLTSEEKGACTFLEKSEERGKCAIHPFRPNVCRGYPFELVKGKLRHIEKVFCPSRWEPGDAEKENFRKAIEAMDSDYRAYHAMVKRWNEMAVREPGKQHHPDEFMRYVLGEVKKALASP
ncbi:MAG: YkgJ family cysteine cluster protein [Candidatus Eremiobacteraeota bacterium]|nr:YkgJ family cysteine cluster protein [Candidatus Eremiobacteraeota bacterium]